MYPEQNKSLKKFSIWHHFSRRFRKKEVTIWNLRHVTLIYNIMKFKKTTFVRTSPVSTRRRFDVDKTLFGCLHRSYNVETTSCACWVMIFGWQCMTLLIKKCLKTLNMEIENLRIKRVKINLKTLLHKDFPLLACIFFFLSIRSNHLKKKLFKNFSMFL